MAQSSSIPHSPKVEPSVIVDPGRVWPVLVLRGADGDRCRADCTGVAWDHCARVGVLFGAYALIDGSRVAFGGVSRHRGPSVHRLHRLAHLTGGLLGIAAALTTLWPALVATRSPSDLAADP